VFVLKRYLLQCYTKVNIFTSTKGANTELVYWEMGTISELNVTHDFTGSYTVTVYLQAYTYK